MTYMHKNSKGQVYYLNTQDVKMRNGFVQRIFYFSRDNRAATGCALPEGYEVVESPLTALPFARRAR